MISECSCVFLTCRVGKCLQNAFGVFLTFRVGQCCLQNALLICRTMLAECFSNLQSMAMLAERHSNLLSMIMLAECSWCLSFLWFKQYSLWSCFCLVAFGNIQIYSGLAGFIVSIINGSICHICVIKYAFKTNNHCRWLVFIRPFSNFIFSLSFGRHPVGSFLDSRWPPWWPLKRFLVRALQWKVLMLWWRHAA